MVNLWPLLLPVAAWSGWWLAHKKHSHFENSITNHLSREYVVGLNYLLNEEQDKAVDLFIKLLDVDSDTVETHLALGSLFRRRGEVERAIRIHQNLIARPQLSVHDRKEALLALGQDYMSAGLFDRAERIFLEVVELAGIRETKSLRGLLAIYQQEKAWESALQVVKKLELSTGQSLHVQSAHYHCEIAEQALNAKLYDKARLSVKQALSVDPMSVRASIMQANIDIESGRYNHAIRALRRVLQQDANFLSEIIGPLVLCYRNINAMDDCIHFLMDTLRDFPRASTIFVIAEELRNQHGIDPAIDFVSEKLSLYPSIRGLNKLIHWHLETAYGKVREKLQMLHDITSKFLEKKPIYRCNQCGFGGRHLHWHCPSCKQWSTMMPVHGLEGD